MRKNSVLRCLVGAVVGLGLIAAANTQPSEEPIHIGPAQHVSSQTPRTFLGECRVASDPTDPRHLIVASLSSGAEESWPMYVYETRDSGASWHLLDRISSPVGPMSDPAVTFDSAGNAFISTFAVGVAPNEPFIDNRDYRGLLFQERHGERRLRGPVAIDGVDFQSSAIDWRGRVVIAGEYMNTKPSLHELRIQTVAFSKSHLAHREISEIPLAKHPLATSNASAILGKTLFIPIMLGGVSVDRLGNFAIGNTEIDMVRYDLVHHKVQRMITIAQAPESQGSRSLAIFSTIVPLIAVDTTSGPFAGRIYVAWPVWEHGHSDVYIASSSDRGLSWSAPHPVCSNLISAGNCPVDDRFAQALAVNKSGILAVTWLERKNDAPKIAWQNRFAMSSDGGESFSTGRALSPDPATIAYPKEFPLPAAQTKLSEDGSHQKMLWINRAFLGGADSGTAITADRIGRFWPVWYDYRSGVAQIWTSPVVVKSVAIKNGSPNLRMYADLTTKNVWAETSVTFNTQTSTAKVRFYVTNASSVPLKGPVVVRLFDATSPSGPVTLQRPFDVAGDAAIIPISERGIPAHSHSRLSAPIIFNLPTITTIMNSLTSSDRSILNLRYDILSR